MPELRKQLRGDDRVSLPSCSGGAVAAGGASGTLTCATIAASGHAIAVSDRSPTAPSRAVIVYQGGVAGELLEPMNPDIVGAYEFMPYRSESHYRLSLALNRDYSRDDVS